MTTPEEILGWSAAFRRLVEAGVREGFAHATLIESESSEGSAFYARALARAINCKPQHLELPGASSGFRPCGDCEPCRRAAAGSFPALSEVWPIGVAVTIGQVQALIAASSAKFGPDITKVFVIHAADRMQIPAANALLKTLEEPPERTVLILATSSASRVLPTIRSRCRTAQLSLPDDAELTARLSLPPISAARMALALEVAGRQPEALLELAGRKKELATWAPPATPGELPMLVKKLLKTHVTKLQDTAFVTPVHALMAGGWYPLNLAGAIAVQIGQLSAALAGGPKPAARRDALAAAMGLTEVHKLLIEEVDEAAAKRAKALEEQYGDGYVHPQMAGEGKLSYPLGRAHAQLILRALLAVLRRVLHAGGDANLLESLAPPLTADRGHVAAGLARLTPGILGELARVAESLKHYAAQNVSIPYVLDELMLSVADVLSGRAVALAADEAFLAEGA